MSRAVLRRGNAGDGPVADVRELAGYRSRATDDELTSYVGMVVFLGSWAMMFVALFFSYGLVRARSPVWPPLDLPALPRLLPGLNTAVIAASSAAVALAVRASRAGRRGRVAHALTASAALGAMFLALQAVVWVRVYRDGLAPTGGPYPSVFYSLTVFHALHVLVGLLALGALAVRARAARGATRTAVRLWGMYWHFVGTVWVVLYTTVYLV